MSPRTSTRKRPPRPENPLEVARLLAAAALERKAEDLLLLEVEHLAGFADYFLLASGRSTRQTTAIAENLVRVLKKAGVKTLGEEGVKEGRWALLDFGDVVAHVFHQPVREFYDLESHWGDAPQIDLDHEELAALLPPDEETP